MVLNARSVELLVCAAGIYACYLYYGVLQNKMYVKQSDGTRFGDTAFVLMIQCAFNAGVAFLTDAIAKLMPNNKVEKDSEKLAKPERPPFFRTLRNPQVLLVAAVYVFAMYTSNEALKYVSYAYQALAKSCKLIPVMVGSIIITGKKYSNIKYACVAAMTVGITAYQFSEDPGKKKHGAHSGSSSDDNSEYLGLVLLAVSLMLDGASGPGQEKLKKLMNNAEQTMASNIWAFVYMAILATAMGQTSHALAYLREHPHLWSTLVLFSLCSGVGQIFIFYTIRAFDSLTLSTITTTRKFFTIVVNVIVLPEENNLNWNQWFWVLIVFCAVGVDSTFSHDKHKSHHHGHAPGHPSAAVVPAGTAHHTKTGSGQHGTEEKASAVTAGANGVTASKSK